MELFNDRVQNPQCNVHDDDFIGTICFRLSKSFGNKKTLNALKEVIKHDGGLHVITDLEPYYFSPIIAT